VKVVPEFTAFLQANIIPVYFIYGLAHFIIGIVVALETGRASQLRISRALPFLAAFELTHGINEWIEMLSMISKEIPTVAREPAWAEIIKVGWLALSFFFLFLFGVRLLNQLAAEPKPWLRLLPVIFFGVFFVGAAQMRLFMPPNSFELSGTLGELWAGYCIGLPAAILACLALLAQRRAFVQENMPQFGRDLVGAALALGWYAILDQIVSFRSPYFISSFINKDVFLNVTGIPVELARTGVIIVFAFFIIRTMRVFEVEYARRLEAANRARFAAQEEATRELSVLYETCRILGASLDVNQLTNDAITQIVLQLDPMIAGMIYLNDSAEHALVLRASRVRDENLTLTPSEIDAAKRTAQQAFETNSIAYETASKSNLSIIAVPLVSHEQAVGALCLAHHTAFSNYAVIQTLARQIGIALENARLYEQVQEKEFLRGQLLERAVAAQEEERKRIARELHDDTGQTLTALGVGLGGVEETIVQNTELAQYQIAELKMMTMRAIDNLREFISDLRPSVLDDMGLVSAVRWFAQQYSERMGIQVDFEVTGKKRRLPSRVATVLFRIVQEGLNNIGRHAQAKRARVQLGFASETVILTIEDDGRGFDVADVLGIHSERRAWGLLGVQERVALVGGKFKIDSAPGRGTKMTIEIPAEAEEAVVA
jgi:signal transduction histidine kinase